MEHKELIEFINKFRGMGKSNSEIESALLGAGWNLEDINAAFNTTEMNPPSPPVDYQDKTSSVPTYSTNSPDKNSDMDSKNMKRGNNLWDAFEHVIMFITMGISAVSIGLIMNYFIDNKILNTLAPYPNYYSYYDDDILGIQIAALIVTLPIFSFFFLRIEKRTKLYPQLRSMLVRKVLIYLTMIITSVVTIICLIGFVYRIINGDLSAESITDFFIIVGISLIIFIYFLLQTKEDRRLS